MPTPMRRRLRMARRGLGYAMAVSLVLVALLLGVASQLLPLAERHPERIAAWLSERSGRPVAFDRVETEWTRRGPLLKLDNLRIGPGRDAVVVGDAEMLVSIYEGLLPGQALSELRLRGLDLTLERAGDGRWQVRGLPGQQKAGGDVFETLEALGELQVVGGKLSVIAPAFGIEAHIPRVNVRLQVSGDRVRAALRAWPQLDGTPLTAVLSLDRRSGDGTAYAGAREADLADWRGLLQLAGVRVEAGQGRAEAWAELRGHRITAVTVDTLLEEVALVPAAGNDERTARFGRVEGRARWRLIDDGWRFDAPVLRVGEGDARQVLDGLGVAGGRRFAVQAERIDIGPLLAVAAFSDRLSPALRDWLQRSRPQAVLRDIRVAGESGGALRAHARIERAGFQALGDAPGISGLGGVIDGDQSGFVLRLDETAPMRFDWPSGFGVVHTVKLAGDIAGWRDGAGWRVATGALRLDGGSFAADVRGGLGWQGDGSRPRIDIAARLDDAAVPVAKGFWVHHRMPPAAVAWLDAALQGGTVRDGRAIISGDLDDWPFRDHQGLFEATARIEQGEIRFQPGWPAVEELDADVRFVAEGFDVSGRGRIAGVAISRIEAGIDRYVGGRLSVDADGDGDARRLLELLRQSPLDDSIGEHLASLQASGPARVGFALRLPMKKGSHTEIDGSVDVDGIKLSDSRWDLAFDQVRGRARYSRGGFRADGLNVVHEGLPGTLALRAGDGHVRDPGHAFEGELQASIPVRELIARVPDLDWLRPHLSGRSSWTVGVDVPRAIDGVQAASRLRLGSDLVGTALELPAPLRKPAGESLAATIETPLPLGSGDVRVALGDRMAVRARSGNGQTGVRIALGSTEVTQPAPAQGLIASGHAAQLDAIEWIALGRAGTTGGAMPLQRIDVTASELQMLAGVFPDTRVVVTPGADGALAVATSGEHLQGRLAIPRSGGQAIVGRFDRVYWRAPTVAADASVAPAATATIEASDVVDAVPAAIASAEADALDPAAVPPLTIDVADFRLNDAALGQAGFRSHPTATGMRIERLHTRADKQSIEVSGDWNGRGAAARTRMQLELRSEDFGELFDGLGFGLAGRIGDGRGRVQFDAGWSGSPAAFSAGALEGRLSIDARDGHLLEVEPGAGRMLGLLSIAQLPRRLLLDFGDLFSKGFAFNRVAGNVVFADGLARSDDLLIDGPAAAIAISGTTHLRSERFDQTIEVRPKAGNLLTAVGAIAGGPVGAAIGAAANVVLEKPLGQIAARVYRVTGPWKSPKVEVQTREQSRRAAAESAPPAG
ncbi:TIGR02099 family protein [Lysobacter maris]|uniref:TIGR02099 family protein n=1 Tax=Marilutibacter maris TaxID=1605891 RepID=A0A508AQA6_9GAMM|nr:YhdP family protein [Lysobacter maris]KAB8190483.1 TIGR02099 family protein [Lysobacter maris]